jgi:hypothetical protein
MRDRTRLRQPAESPAHLRGDIATLMREAFDVSFIDDHVFPRRRGTAFAAPGVGGIHDDGLQHEARIVAPVERQIGLFVPCAITEVCVVPDELSCETLAVRVDQKLVRIEAVARFRRVGAIHAIAVELAGGRGHFSARIRSACKARSSSR